MPMSERSARLYQQTLDDGFEEGFGAFGKPARKSAAGSRLGRAYPPLEGLDDEPIATRIPRGDAAGWRRWKMTSFDPPPPPPPAPPPPLHEEPAEPAPPPIDFAALEAMREKARKEGYAQGYTQGQTQGYGDGHREGYARGLDTAKQEAARLRELAGNFTTALHGVDNEIGQTLVSLALDIARKLVLDTVAANPAVLLPAVRELLTTEPALAGSPCLLLHPDDVALVQTHLAGELEAAGWTVRADSAVARGGCIATAASGELDATLATRWSRVMKAMGRDDPWEPADA